MSALKLTQLLKSQECQPWTSAVRTHMLLNCACQHISIVPFWRHQAQTVTFLLPCQLCQVTMLFPDTFTLIPEQVTFPLSHLCHLHMIAAYLN